MFLCNNQQTTFVNSETDEWSFEQHMGTKLRCQVIRFAPAQTQADASNSGQLIKSHSFALPGSFSNSSGKQNQLKKKTLYSILREFGHDKVTCITLNYL